MKKTILSLGLAVTLSSSVTFNVLANDDVLQNAYNRIQSQYGECRHFAVDDYDGNGTKEAFLIQGNYESGLYDGKIWYIDSYGNTAIVDDNVYGYNTTYSIVTAGNRKFFVWENDAGGSGSSSSIIGCNNGNAYELDISRKYGNFGYSDGKYSAYDFNVRVLREFLFNESTLQFEDKSASNEIKVVFNGEYLEFDQPPVIINDRVMVPIRVIFEAMGYDVQWFDQTKTAIAVRGNDFIGVEIGLNVIQYSIGGGVGTFECDVPPQIISDRVLVPVRAIAETVGSLVSWDESTKTVGITY